MLQGSLRLVLINWCEALLWADELQRFVRFRPLLPLYFRLLIYGTTKNWATNCEGAYVLSPR